MSWINHVKDYQNQHGCSYKQALKDAKPSYESTGGKLGIKKAFKNLGNTKEMHYGRNINNYIQTGNKIAQKYVKPIATAVPGVGSVAKLGFALADAQAGASQAIYNKTRKPTQTVEGGMIRPWEDSKCPSCGHCKRRNPNEMHIAGSGLYSDKPYDNGSMFQQNSIQTVGSTLFFDPKALTNIHPTITETIYGNKKVGGSFRVN